MVVLCCKLREWVWTETGKGDRLGGDSRVGPSPCSERPAPPHSLQTHAERDQRPASFTCRPVVLYRLFRICLAMPCSPASAITPCLLPCLHLLLCHRSSPCAPGSSSVCKDCPAGSHITGTALSSLCIGCINHSCVLLPSIHFHEPETAVSSLATSSCTKEPETALGSLATSSNGLWDGTWHAVLG